MGVLVGIRVGVLVAVLRGVGVFTIVAVDVGVRVEVGVAVGRGVGVRVGGITPQPKSALFTPATSSLTVTEPLPSRSNTKQVATASLPKAMFTPLINSSTVT